MPELIECVPNFSEGRDPGTLAALRGAIADVSGVRLLDVHADADHHRSVYTFAGSGAAVAEAAFRAARVAAERIDLRSHRGQHPRIGATDVIPFVPLEGAALERCVALARAVGERIGRELGIPVYLYGRAATRPDRAWLPAIRRGGFEALRDAIRSDPARLPDFGPTAVHPTAGATAVGARPFLVAFNVYLSTPDVAVARDIARRVRASGGGLPAVQARGFLVRGSAQVSLNLLDPDRTPLALAFESVAREATRHGVEVVESEIVGLVPERVIQATAAQHLKLRAPLTDRILETRLRATAEPPLDAWLSRLAEGTPAPGGGSAAALAGAAAAALAAMVAKLGARRGTGTSPAAKLAEVAREADALRERLTALIAEDERVYRGVVEARRGPGGPALDDALLAAAGVPLETARAAARVRELVQRAAREGHPAAASDARVAVRLADAALASALDAVRENVGAMARSAAGAPLLAEVERLSAG